MKKFTHTKHVLSVIITICSLCLFLINPVFAANRQKSAVLTVYNNNSGTTYNEELDKIVHAELQKRLEGLYIELDGEPFKALFKKTNVEETADPEIINKVREAGADYFIYLELFPFQESENYNLVYHRKSMTATVLIRIVDMNEKKTLHQERFSLKGKDSTDAWFIGDKSVAKKALQSTMFKAGEIISVKLPL